MTHPVAVRAAPPAGLLVVTGLILYFAFFVATSPPAVLAWALALATNGTLALERPEGRVWQGHAGALAITDLSGRVQRYERLRWELLGAGVSRGQLAFDVRIEDPNLRGSGTVAVSRHGVRLKEAEFHSPARAISGYVPALASGEFLGTVSIRCDDFVLERANLTGEAIVSWRNAASGLSKVNPLGDYVARVIGLGSRVEFQIETVSGILQVEGRGVWRAVAGLSFTGWASGLPRDIDELVKLLELAGPEYRDTARKLTFTWKP